MTADVRKVVELTRGVRACFNRLKALGDALHEDLGITASMRSVLESLHEDGARTVPQIAKSKSVTRQHIQTIVDALTAAGLVALQANPAHKRSPLVVLTAAGRKAFADMRRREATVLATLSGALPPRGVSAAVDTLKALEAALDRELARRKRWR
ncbi:MAG TPA: MarR family transcriptional regulator [Alphaproteobacteria bacterium]